jgi:hypothetical protein
MISAIGLISTFIVATISILLGFIVGRAIGRIETRKTHTTPNNYSQDNTSIALPTQPDDMAATGS